MYDKVFNPETIYKMVFFNVKTATQYPNLDEFKKNDKKKFEQWISFHAEDGKDLEHIYSTTGCYKPELSKIISGTICTVSLENGELKRNIILINDNSEKEIINKLTQYFNQMDLGGELPIICGHNVTGYDIPTYLKRAMVHYNEFKIPKIIKNYLSAKPWESNVVDTLSMWKFQGYSKTSLMDIANHLNLKMKFDVDIMPDLNNFYWRNINNDEKDTLKYVSLQSANQVNLTIQLINKLRLM